MKKLSVIISLLIAFTFPMSAQAEFSDAELSEWLENHPEALINAMQKYEQKQRDQAQEEQERKFAQYTEQLINDPASPFVGPENANIAVIEFFDFSCNYSKRFAPSVEKLIANNPNVKFVFKPIAFVSRISKYQAKAGLAAHKQGRFMAFYKEIMAYSGTMKEEDVDAIAQKIGLDMPTYSADVNSASTMSELEKISSLSQNLYINGVPSFFINTKQLEVTSAEQIQKEIDDLKN